MEEKILIGIYIWGFFSMAFAMLVDGQKEHWAVKICATFILSFFWPIVMGARLFAQKEREEK